MIISAIKTLNFWPPNGDQSEHTDRLYDLHQIH